LVRSGQDDIDALPDEVRRERREPIGFTFSEPIFDDEGLSLGPPELMQPLPKGIGQGCVGLWKRGRQSSDPSRLARLLRLGSERRGEECTRASEECASVHH
jgi:hypothetical protein